MIKQTQMINRKTTYMKFDQYYIVLGLFW